MSSFEFSAAFQQHYPSFYSFALSLTRNASDAEDLVQESAYKAYRYIDSFKVGTNFKSWVNTILKNTFINKYHSRKRRNVVDAPIEDVSKMGGIIDQSISNLAISNIQMEEIHDIIEDLDEKFKTPFLMYYSGYQYDEIAEILDIPLGTVKSRIFYARKDLRKNLHFVQ